MRIAAYGMHFPDNSAMAKRLTYYCKALAIKGIDMKIYSLDTEAKQGIFQGIRFEHFQKKRIIHRYFDQFLNTPLLLMYFKKIVPKYDIILVGRLGWITLLFMSVIAHKKGVKLVMELNENPSALGGGRLTPLWLKKINGWILFNIPFRTIDGFICISKSLDELADKYKKRNANKILIPILCDLPEPNPSATSNEFPYILHAGALSETKDGVIAMFEAFALACKRTSLSLKFILTQRIATKKLLLIIDKIISENRLTDRVIFTGMVSSDKLDELRNNATMTIVNKPHNLQNEYNFPTKLGELLSAGVPVIASKTGEVGRYLNDNHTAYMVDANNSMQIANKIIEILENPEKAKKIAENGKQLSLKMFYFQNYSDDLFKFFSSIR